MARTRNRPSSRTRSHTFTDVAGIRRPRAWFSDVEAQRAARRVFDLTGRRYSAYPCKDPICGGWHIGPCRRRPEDLARSA
jgi:hypothetical protein